MKVVSQFIVISLSLSWASMTKIIDDTLLKAVSQNQDCLISEFWIYGRKCEHWTELSLVTMIYCLAVTRYLQSGRKTVTRSQRDLHLSAERGKQSAAESDLTIHKIRILPALGGNWVCNYLTMFDWGYLWLVPASCHPDIGDIHPKLLNDTIIKHHHHWLLAFLYNV